MEDFSKIISPVVLVVLDGFGYSNEKKYNAILNANTPFWDKLWLENPCTLISSSGINVGLPEKQMGNSEVGHITLGSGRIVLQDYQRINKAINDGTFFQNNKFKEALLYAKENNKAIHILGLLSQGGVHSHEDHIFAFLKIVKEYKLKKVYIHVFLDGRDTLPSSAKINIEKLEKLLKEFKIGKIASIMGRYYAMDRDRRFDRTKKAYELLTEGKAEYSAKTALLALENAYKRGETDEFVKPTLIILDEQQNVNKQQKDEFKRKQKQKNYILDDDVVVLLNFRADRIRQISHALYSKDFYGFAREKIVKIGKFVTLTEYANDLKSHAAFTQQLLKNCLGEVLANNNLNDLRIAETEKYAHVTFFFNGGQDVKFKNEDRILIPSPKVATYDLAPKMSALKVVEKLCLSIKSRKYNFILCNFANADMVGHTGDFAATIVAIETLDHCLKKITKVISEVNGDLIITADHGNAEKMFDEKENQIYTSHTNNLVPCLYFGDKKVKKIVKGAGLKDIAPTVLHLLGLKKPNEMKGNSIFKF